jgi:hypothetical protein
MTSDSLIKTLEVGRRVLGVLRQGDDRDVTSAIENLMYSAYDLGKAISASPELLSNVELQRFLDEAVSVLKDRYMDLSFYPWTVVHRLEGSWEGDEWVQLCIARSGLQFFIDLFRETSISEVVTAVDASDIDEFIRNRGKDEGYVPNGEIPPEIPLSHWWWWYPEAPPPRR